MKHLKWDFIFILSEFQEHLTTLDLIEVSLLNGFIRGKLIKTIFSDIGLGGTILQRLPDIDFNDKDLFKDTPDRGYNLPYLKNSIVEPFLSELIEEVTVFSPHVNSLKFDSLQGTACFLMPLASQFNQLTSLKFYDCTLDLRDFKQLMDRLTSLESLVLLQSNPYEFIFDHGITDFRGVFLIPPKCYQSLKKLQLEYTVDTNEYVLEFLSSNPQLLCVILPLKHLNSDGIKVLSENNNLNQIIIDPCYFNQNAQLSAGVPIINSLKSLHLTNIFQNSYSKLYEIVSSFSTIRILKIDLVDYDTQFIANILSKLTQVKSLMIKAEYLYLYDINLDIYDNIEVLKLDICADDKTLYKLPSPPTNLKYISILSGVEYKENFNYLKDNHNCSHWEIKLTGEVIICKAIIE
ncbi:hypothetical protein CONCODRAFT_10496 [Conidiobolus coronatus NRRL 28638]|uniref:RNI-like protein n=1 Tax=Conidiobolus coronatus (strain ATCC 28846 / CBS 209.66 / NRRL 28638) TaxID=796925 RepID=A0A137NXQ2_CONC2|nr:hypothetical protein CONCODRAFT_10496 [Conidiobolus coronatus NRRL 28638]|eukprot:KXN67448.1 hypothetical protein CONCODRAFT_10496 [Conidiobolus coronatus NRRL 28638]